MNTLTELRLTYIKGSDSRYLVTVYIRSQKSNMHAFSLLTKDGPTGVLATNAVSEDIWKWANENMPEQFKPPVKDLRLIRNGNKFALAFGIPGDTDHVLLSEDPLWDETHIVDVRAWELCRVDVDRITPEFTTKIPYLKSH